MMELWQLGAGELTAAYDRGDLTPSAVVDELLARIGRLDPLVGAFREITAERAVAEAVEMTGELRQGHSRGPLHGIPVAVKELFDVAGTKGCYGSEVFSNRTSQEDAEAVRRLRQAGAIVVGTTRSHEFGWGITNQHATLGSTSNPWNTDLVPGGSSGGSAAALATGMVPLALGSDTGGSIRIPAGYCGVTGIKPTYGRVSKRGAVSLAPSLDHPGPMARSVSDLAVALQVVSGFDPQDPSTIADPLPALGAFHGGLRIAVAPALHLTQLSESYQKAFDDVVEASRSAGAIITEVEVEGAADIRPTFGVIQMAEAYHVHSSTLGTFPAQAERYGSDVRRRLEMAAGIEIGDYLGARERAATIRRVIDHTLAQTEVIVTPMSGGGPSKVDSPDVVEHLGRLLPFRDLVMDYTVPQDLTGAPAAVIPAGADENGVPIGIQFTSARGREDLALAAAAAAESELGLGRKWPGLAVGSPAHQKMES